MDKSVENNGPTGNGPTGKGLSERAKQLIPKARIVSFSGWTGWSADAIALLQQADDEGNYLTDEELSVISAAGRDAGDAIEGDAIEGDAIDTVAVVQTLRDQAASIVDEARAEVLQAFPDILKPGGGLHPPMRAEACWRDFWQFLRCITYGIAGANTDYTSDTGLAAMEALYEELQVPLPAMVRGLEGIKTASLKRIEPGAQGAIAPYFDHLIGRLSTFG